VFQLLDLETRALDVLRNVPCQMASARKAFLHRLQPRLPTGNLRVGRVAMFYEVKRAARLQDASHLGERHIKVWDGAQGPRRKRGVELRRR
jgi:hypothetical protein